MIPFMVTSVLGNSGTPELVSMSMQHIPRPEIGELDRATWNRWRSAPEHHAIAPASGRHRRRLRLLGVDLHKDQGSLSDSMNEAQMYPGTGTHFVNIFVGKPHQTVSVIVDTGSHYTAFPCNTCSGCGKHTENYFETSKSSTCMYPVPCSHGCQHSCSGSDCGMSQSYTEGSSWFAKEAIDDVWMAQHDEGEVGTNSKFKARLSFGCQFKETGLFNTQVSNGIMGFAHEDSSTMVPKLMNAGLISSKSFSMCFQRQFGVIVLGGTDVRIHQRPMLYVPYTRSSNWYAVSVKAVSIGAAVRTDNVQTSAKLESIGSTTPFGTGKGTIVDSGTTDTYLPSSVAAAFKAAFSRATNLLPGGYRTGVEYHLPIGHVYSTGNGGSVRPALPDIVFTLAGAPGAPDVNVVMWPSAYLELVQHTKGSTQGTFKARVYLDEWGGAVLGANVMRNHDVHFDQESNRLGWAPSSCAPPDSGGPAPATTAPTTAPTATPTGAPTPSPTRLPTPSPTSSPTPSPTPMPTPACVAGTRRGTSGGCEACKPGTFTDAENQESCSLCGACDGEMVRSGCGTGAGVCSHCPDGKYKEHGLNATATFSCTACAKLPACDAGMARTGCMGNSTGSCVRCEAGWFLAEAGDSGSNSTGATAVCKACPAGRTSAAAQSSCDKITPSPTPLPTPLPTTAPTVAPTLAPTNSPTPAAPTQTPTPALYIGKTTEGNGASAGTITGTEVTADDDANPGEDDAEVGTGVIVGAMFAVGVVVVVLVGFTRSRRRLGAQYQGNTGRGVQRSRAALQSLRAGRGGAGVSTRIGAHRLQNDDDDDGDQEVDLGTLPSPNPAAVRVEEVVAVANVDEGDGDDPFQDESL